MIAEALVALMLRLSPRALPMRTQPLAEAIVEATSDDEMQRVLVLLSFVETGFNRPGSIPFGLSCCHHRGDSLTQDARRAVQIIQRSALQCGRRWEVRFGWYHTGRCVADTYGVQMAARLRRLR